MTRRAAILSHLLFNLPLAAGLLFTAGTAAAQTSLNVVVPFAFSANGQHLPAGSYRVQRRSEYFLTIRNVQTKSAVTVMIRPENGRPLESHSRLIFDRIGNRSYLTEVWTPDTSRYSKLTGQHSVDQELAMQNHPAPSTIEVAAK